MNADLVKLLCSNHPPTESQTWEIKRLLGEEEMWQVEDPVKKTKRDETVSLLKTIIAPIRRIPPELWGEVFVHCRNTRFEEGCYWSILDTQEAPSILTRVCSSWRAFAHATPGLWDSVQVNTPLGSTGMAAALWTILQRSGNLPLTVQITRRDLGPGSAENIEQDVWFFPSLNIELETFDIALPFQTPFPMLSSVDIQILTGDSVEEEVEEDESQEFFAVMLAALQDAPSLREVRLSGLVDFTPALFSSGFPWSQLTSLELSLRIDLSTASTIAPLRRAGDMRTLRPRRLPAPRYQPTASVYTQPTAFT
ncbi:hypothetical protein C8R43DRAFT_1077252 [Mycena crocata]|nr:hypothetical protein C8R43DRAFT_1077252 [Mycena crocata]